jgi:hypothetical protein
MIRLDELSAVLVEEAPNKLIWLQSHLEGRTIIGNPSLEGISFNTSINCLFSGLSVSELKIELSWSSGCYSASDTESI